jgi:mannose-6-phosphate isomerase-like protein (cupin superfamily)
MMPQHLTTQTNILDAFASIHDYWDPRIISELNGQAVKLAKIQGKFIWHHHKSEDELFWVVFGTMGMGLRDPSERSLMVQAGEMIMVPKGIEHCPSSITPEAWIVLFEPTTTLNTGNIINERTRATLERL